jgi:hypothetical protein
MSNIGNVKTALYECKYCVCECKKGANCDVWDRDFCHNGKCLVAGVSVVGLLALFLCCGHSILLCCMPSFMMLCSVLCNTLWINKWAPTFPWNVEPPSSMWWQLCRLEIWGFQILRVFSPCWWRYWDPSQRRKSTHLHGVIFQTTKILLLVFY